MIPDVIGEIKTLLAADSAVEALVGDRVFGGELPESENPNMPRAAVIVTPAGGPGRPGVTKWRRERVLTVCYGATLHEAWTVHAAVREALETMSRSGSLLALEMASEAAPGRESEKQWPFQIATYRLLAAVEA